MLTEADGLWLQWTPPGPVADRFMASNADLQIINGPIGSGKTTAVLLKGLRLGANQQPASRVRAKNHRGRLVPVRLFKLAVIQVTYRQLWRSTIPSWHKRVPQSAGIWIGPRNAPSIHRIPSVLGRDTINETVLDYQVEFAAIQDANVEEFMRGYEVTAFYLVELDTLAWEVLTYAQGRAGRYPDMADGGPTWKGVLADCNAPVRTAELYQQIFLKRPEELRAAGVALFVQPGGRSPGAENRANLPEDYYVPKIGQDAMYIARMIDNKPGYSRGGKPVHPEFIDAIHVADHELEAIAGLPLYLGFDGGLDPAMMIAQKLGDGRWNFLDELVSEHGTGPQRFAMRVNELLSERYPNWHAIPLSEEAIVGRRAGFAVRHPRIRAFCDPAATYGGDRENEDDAAWSELVGLKTGIRIEPAPSNDTTTRRAAMTRVLTLPSEKPAFQLSPRCKVAREGYNGGFRYRRLQVPGSQDVYGDTVEKNLWSHICEAGEYVLLGGGEGAEVYERRQRGYDVRAQRQDDDFANWNWDRMR